MGISGLETHVHLQLYKEHLSEECVPYSFMPLVCIVLSYLSLKRFPVI